MTDIKPIPVEEWRYLPQDLLTHIGDWEKGVQAAMDASHTEAAASYWEKQLQVLARIKEATTGNTAYLTEMTPVEAEMLVANAESKSHEQIKHIAKFAVGMAMMNMGMQRLEVSTEDLSTLINQYNLDVSKNSRPGDVLTYTLQHKDAKIEEQRVANGYASDAGKFDTFVIDRMAQLLKQRLAEKRMEGKGGWQDKDDCSADVLRAGLQRHLDETGDHLNAIAYLMMLHYRGDALGLAEMEA